MYDYMCEACDDGFQTDERTEVCLLCGRRGPILVHTEEGG